MTDLAEDFGIAQDNGTEFRSCKGDVESAGVVQESDALMIVASYAAENDVVLFSTLEGIHAGHFYLLVQFFFQGTVKLHVGCNIGSLTFVWGDDTDLTGHHTGFEEFRHHLLHVRCLGPVQE